MSSPDGTNNNKHFAVKMTQQSVPTRKITLNNTTFMTVPANMTQPAPLRPVILQAATIVPVHEAFFTYQVVLPRARTPQIRRQRPVHFKVNSAGEVISPGSSVASPSSSRPLARRPLKPSETKVLCSNCGIQSSNTETCDSCKKTITKNDKCNRSSFMQTVEDGLRATRDEIERKAQRGISSSSFYNGGRESDFSRYVRTSAATSSIVRVQRKRPNLLRNSAVPENVCITISSDSEDESDSVAVVPDTESETAKQSQRQSQSEGETPSKKLRQDDPAVSTVKVTTPVKVSPQPVQIAEATSQESGVVKSDEELERATLNLKIDSVRIGQMKLSPSSVLRLSHIDLSMTARCTHTQNDRILTVSWTNVTGCELCGDEREPCLYLVLQQGSLPKLREQLEMEKGKFPYFDPTGIADQRYFIFYINRPFIKSTSASVVDILIRKIGLIRRKLKKPSSFLRLVNFEESERRQILAASIMEQRISLAEATRVPTKAAPSPKEVENSTPTESKVTTRNQSKETSEDLKFMFNGPRVQLFVYPAPPVKGGITVTNEDQFCLNDGEFLNDVIIEFYLKYVYNKVLAENDRKRSHIFSCFFYERLMQKSKKLKFISQAERRHSQVKKWTRNIDIFSKDFIFVPINEASHWYLAVICFPWMEMKKNEAFQLKDKVSSSQERVTTGLKDDPKSKPNSQSESRDEKEADNDNSTKLKPNLSASVVAELAQTCGDDGEESSSQESRTTISPQKRSLVSVNLPKFITVRRKKAKIEDSDSTASDAKIVPECEGDVSESQNIQEPPSDEVSGAGNSEKQVVLETVISDCPPVQRSDDSTQNETSITPTANCTSGSGGEKSLKQLGECEPDSTEPSDQTHASEACHDDKKASSDKEALVKMEAAGKSSVDVREESTLDVKEVKHVSRQNEMLHSPAKLEQESLGSGDENGHISQVDVKEVKLTSREIDVIATESAPGKTLEPQSQDSDENKIVSLTPKRDASEHTVSSDPDSLHRPDCKANLLELFVCPDGPSFSLPKDLEEKCTVSPKRKPQVLVNKVQNQSPVLIKSMRLQGISQTPIRISSSSLSSEDSVIILSSPDHTDAEVCQKIDHSSTCKCDGVHQKTCGNVGSAGNEQICGKTGNSSTNGTVNDGAHQKFDGSDGMGHVQDSMDTIGGDLIKTSRSFEATPVTPLNLRFETSSHELSDCDVIMVDSSRDDSIMVEKQSASDIKTMQESKGTPKDPDSGHDPKNATCDSITDRQEPMSPKCSVFSTNAAAEENKKGVTVLDNSTPPDTMEGKEILASQSADESKEAVVKSPLKRHEQAVKDPTDTHFKAGENINRSDNQSQDISLKLPQEDQDCTSPKGENDGKTVKSANEKDCGSVTGSENQPSGAAGGSKTSPKEEGSMENNIVGSEVSAIKEVTVYKRPCILIFDSLRGPSRSKIATSLREYLTMEWKTRKQGTHGEKIFDKDTMKMCSVTVPQQDNYTDCGLFLLHYVEKFFSKPIKEFSLPIKLENWFDPEECSDKRKEIKKVIDELYKDWVSRENET